MNKNSRKGSLVSVSTVSSKANLSQSSEQKNVGLGQSQFFPTETPILAHDSNMLSPVKLESPVPGDLGETPYDIILTTQNSSSQKKYETLSVPNQSEESGLANSSSGIPDNLCQPNQDSPDVLTIMSSQSTPIPPPFQSLQLDKLLSDLEEMDLETPEQSLSKSTDGSPEADKISEFKGLSLAEPPNLEFKVSKDNPTHKTLTEFQTFTQVEPEVVPDITKTSETCAPSSLGSDKDCPESLSIPQSPHRLCEETDPSLNPTFHVDQFHSSENTKDAAETSHTVATSSQPDIPEKQLTEHCPTDFLWGQQGQGSTTPSNDSGGVKEEASSQSIQDQPLPVLETSPVETLHDEVLSSQSLSDLTPETVTTARSFCFEEETPTPSSGYLDIYSDEVLPRASEQHSEESLTPVDDECFISQPVKAEMTSSTSDEEYSIPPGYTEITSSVSAVHSNTPPTYAGVVHRVADSPTFEYSDPEPFFDCRQAASDFSETELDEPQTGARSSRRQPKDHLNHPRVPEKVTRKMLLSSGSEDYEDAPFVHKPLHHVHEESEVHYSEASDEEYSLCEASQPPPVCETGASEDIDKSLAREISAELGSMSESSDDEFFTTRIVRRRVVIQGDEMPDLPAQSVTEEKYEDENGHLVVKKVTRKIIRKCVSADAGEHQESSVEGAPQGSITMAEGGDGYSKVVKRTVVKSEGDHTEVTFTGCEGFSSSRQAGSSKVSHIERTTVVEGERTMTHKGDPSLASDLPSAQDDFKQALGYLSGFSRTELPHVVERETVREDGTVVRRAHMRKGRTFRRTAVKGAGQHKQVLLKQVDNPRKGSKPCDLQQHLHQLFHRYNEKEKEDSDMDDEEEE